MDFLTVHDSFVTHSSLIDILQYHYVSVLDDIFFNTDNLKSLGDFNYEYLGLSVDTNKDIAVDYLYKNYYILI